jgi:phenylalanyl-tRNA synthetase beta chain
LDIREIHIEDAQKSHAYLGLELKGVQVAPSPSWLQNRLKAIGLVPKNNIVDATNYILHHTGQPVHAFDADTLNGGIVVRKASPEEKIRLLDGREIQLDELDLVIADDEKVLALAGIMGGLDCAVTEKTVNLFLEIAHFHGGTIRKSAKRHVLNTDASFRFERGIDELGLEQVALFLSELILSVAGGEVQAYRKVEAEKFITKTLEMEVSALDAFAGMHYPSGRIKAILSSLGFSVSGEDILTVAVPSWRNDVSQVVDLYEEIMRIYGYDEIPLGGKMQISLGNFQGMQKKRREDFLRNYLIDKGFFEAQTNSLVSPDWYDDADACVVLSNPLSADMSILRRSLIPGLLQSIAYNQNRQAKSVKLFELGRVYEITEKGYKETPSLAVVLWGDADQETWETKRRPVDYYDLKRVLQGLLLRMDLGFVLEDLDIKKVSVKWLKRAEVKGSVFAVEVPLKKLFKPARKQIKVEPVSKYFGIRRDLSLVVERSQGFERWLQLVKQSKIKFLKDVKVFDVFEGAPLEEGKKSLSLSFHFHRSDQTMEDKDADAGMEKLMAVFEAQGAFIRR